MTTVQAKRKYDALLRMVPSRGCTEAECATARRLAAAIASKYGFARPAQPPMPKPDFDERFHRAEARAAKRFGWEFRKCGKPSCHCTQGGAHRHGPYRYGKKRDGRTVRSVYEGK